MNQSYRITFAEWMGISTLHHGSLELEGPMKNVLDTLIAKLNIKYNLAYVDGSFWNGMIDTLEENNADIALGPFPLIHTIFSKADFSNPIFLFGQQILSTMKSGDDNVKDFLQNLLDMDVAIWIYLALLMFCISVQFVITVKADLRTHISRPTAQSFIKSGILYYGILFTSRTVPKSYNLTDSLWNLLIALLFKGSTRPFVLQSQRIAMGFLFTGLAFILIFINCNIHTELVSSSSEKPIDNLHDLANSKNVIPMYVIGQTFETFLHDSKEDIAKILYGRALQSKFSAVGAEMLYAIEAFTRLASATHAWVTESADMKVIANATCALFPKARLHISKQTPFVVPSSIGFNKKTVPKQVQRQMNKIISQLTSSGLITYWRLSTEPKNIPCLEDAALENSYQPEDLSSMIRIFYNWIFAMFLCLLVLILELSVWCCKNCKLRLFR